MNLQQYQISSRMQEEHLKKISLDILCIGEIQAGKTYFLKQYSTEEVRQTLCGPYDIYAKKINNCLIYLHELSEQENIYLERQYDGVVFFVDIVNTWNVAGKILEWMELLSKLTGKNIFKMPLRIIITKAQRQKNDDKWKRSLQLQLISVVDLQQIIYFYDLKHVQVLLEGYFGQIAQGTAKGIKSSNENHLRLYGFYQLWKVFAINVKLTLFRCLELYDKHIRSKFGGQVSKKKSLKPN